MARASKAIYKPPINPVISAEIIPSIMKMFGLINAEDCPPEIRMARLNIAEKELSLAVMSCVKCCMQMYSVHADMTAVNAYVNAYLAASQEDCAVSEE